MDAAATPAVTVGVKTKDLCHIFTVTDVTMTNKTHTFARIRETQGHEVSYQLREIRAGM